MIDRQHGEKTRENTERGYGEEKTGSYQNTRAHKRQAKIPDDAHCPANKRDPISVSSQKKELISGRLLPLTFVELPVVKAAVREKSSWNSNWRSMSRMLIA